MKKYGILAYPAKHSLSPRMHNAAFKACGIDAKYEIFEISGKNLRGFMKKVRTEPILGLSVSLPYKEKVIKFLDEIDEDARKIGAVNTVLNKNGILYGYNTDFIGATAALKEVVKNLKGKKAIVVGAGGAARAICYGLLKEGADVLIMNRNKSKADRIALEFAEMFNSKIQTCDLEDPEYVEDMLDRSDTFFKATILIHATSRWVKGGDIWDEVPFFLNFINFEKIKIVMDISYNIPGAPDPLTTPLTDFAEYEKKKIITGDKMLLYQAATQFKIWTGKKAPTEVMRKALGF